MTKFPKPRFDLRITIQSLVVTKHLKCSQGRYTPFGIGVPPKTMETQSWRRDLHFLTSSAQSANAHPNSETATCGHELYGIRNNEEASNSGSMGPGSSHAEKPRDTAGG